MPSFDDPETIEKAVERLTTYLPLSDRVFIAKLEERTSPWFIPSWRPS